MKNRRDIVRTKKYLNKNVTKVLHEEYTKILRICQLPTNQDVL